MSKPPSRLRRLVLRRILPGLLVLLVGLVGLGAWRARSKMKGPPVPVCSAAPLARTNFESPQQISSATTPGALAYDIEPGAALLPDGTLAVVFNARTTLFGGKSGLVAARLPLAGPPALKPYPTDRAHAFDAWMAADPQGMLHLVWLGHDGGSPEKNMKVGYSQSKDGLDWSPPGMAHAPTDCPPGARGCIDKTMIAAGSSGLYVIYFSEPGEGLRVTRSSDFAKPAFTTSVLAGVGAYGGVVLSPAQTLYLTYVEATGEGARNRYGDPGFRVVVTRSTDNGQHFSPAVAVSAPDQSLPFYFSNPQIGVDEARGWQYVVYPAGTPDGRWDIYLAASQDGMHWQQHRINDDAPCANHMIPSIAVDPKTGQVHLIWLENRTGTGAVAYAYCEAGGASCSKNESVSDRSFADYSFARHFTYWVGDYATLVLDAEHRWLHAIWAQPVEEDGDAASRMFHARRRLPD